MEKIWYTESQVFSKNWNSLLKRSEEIILEYFFILERTYWKLTVQLIMSNSIFNLNPCQTSTFYSFSGRGFKMLSYSLKKKKEYFMNQNIFQQVMKKMYFYRLNLIGNIWAALVW